MMRTIILIATLPLTTLLQAEDNATPPETWKSGLRSRHQLVWDQLRKDDGKVTAGEVIEWIYKNDLSHHDGDSQLHAAFCLIQLADDPFQHLRKMMAEDKPERRAYAAYIAGILGDARFSEDIKRLGDDDARLGQFDGEWFWDTVADIANSAARSLGEGGLAAKMRAEGESVAAWFPPAKPKAGQVVP